jgi:predicted nucleic acid-binding protein
VTIVVDASALIEMLLGSPRMADPEGPLGAENRRRTLDIADLEIMSSLRRSLRLGAIPPSRADAAVEALARVRIRRERAGPLRARVWQLRATHSPYDAAYVALAERLRAPLVTTDRRLARSHGHEAEIIDLSG